MTKQSKKNSVSEEATVGKITLEKADKYKWGEVGVGWLLKTSPEMTIAQRVLSPGVKEKKHYHNISWQFFYILEGEGTILVDDELIPINADESIEVNPLSIHQMINTGDAIIRYLVISTPNSFEDRVEV